MANIVNSKKLLHSKWTALKPNQREKHHLVVELIFKTEKDPIPSFVVMEAVINHRQWQMDWQELKDSDKWSPGWR